MLEMSCVILLTLLRFVFHCQNKISKFENEKVSENLFFWLVNVINFVRFMWKVFKCYFIIVKDKVLNKLSLFLFTIFKTFQCSGNVCGLGFRCVKYSRLEHNFKQRMLKTNFFWFCVSFRDFWIKKRVKNKFKYPTLEKLSIA